MAMERECTNCIWYDDCDDVDEEGCGRFEALDGEDNDDSELLIVFAALFSL